MEGFRTAAPSIQWGGARRGWGTVPHNKGTPLKGDPDAEGVPGGRACPVWGSMGHQSTKYYSTPERVWGRSGGSVEVGGDSGRGDAGGGVGAGLDGGCGGGAWGVSGGQPYISAIIQPWLAIQSLT